MGFVFGVFLFCFILFCLKACGILAAGLGIKSALPALEGKVLSTGPPEKSPYSGFCREKTFEGGHGML